MRRACLILVLIAGCSQAESAKLTPWQEDLRFLAAELPARHVEPFFAVSEADWRKAVDELDRALPSMSDAEARGGLHRIVAMLGDGHTTILPPRMAPMIPLGLHAFADGWHVAKAPAEHADVVGGRLASVGGRPLDEALDLLTPMLSHDNASQLLSQLSRALVDPTLLAAVGLAPRYEIDKGGARTTLELPPGGRAVMPPLPETPLSRSKAGTYWNDHVADARLVYFQYNACADDPDYPMAKLAAGTLGFLDANPVEKIVIDLRQNGGGNSEVLRPLIEGLVERKDRVQVYVAIGRVTFSSSLMNAIELDRRAGAILVGEPTGGKPHHHGQVTTFQLPRSKLRVQYSTREFTFEGYDGDALAPEIAVSPTAAEFFAGKDPVLDAIIAHRPGNP